MGNYTKTNVLFLFLWNILLFNAVHGATIYAIQDQPVLANYSKDDGLNNSNVAQDGTLQKTDNNNVINPNENKADSQNQNQNETEILNEVIQKLLGLSQSSSNNPTVQNESTDNPQNENSIGITIIPVSQDDVSQNNSPVDNTSNVVPPHPEETAPTSTAVQVYTGPTSTQSQNSADSDGITVLPVTQNDSSKNITPDETIQLVLNESATEMVQAQNVAPTPVSAENNSVSNPQQINEPNSTAGNDAANQGCGVRIVDPSTKLQLKQVTVSQILYHLKMQYDQLDLKQDDNGKTYEITETQKSFLKEMLLSEKTASENNKNIVSTTYAAYYSAEYTYTFALCKLHHITKSFKDQQNPKHADISSKCSQIMETFSSFNMSYKETISEVMENGEGQVLKYENDDADKTGNTVGKNSDNSNTNSPTKKISTTNDETIQKQNLEKDLHGYNDNKFYNRVKSEDEKLDQFDLKQNQQIGDSTYSNETKGKKSDSVTYLLSEVKEIPKDKPLDDPSNGAKELKKMSNTLRIASEAETRGHLQNAEGETDSDRVQQYDRSEKQLDQFARNYLDDDNNTVGGNIKNAELQDVQTHYSAVTEHFRDVDEQVTKPRTDEKDNTSKIYVFKQAVEKLTTYIQILNVFIENMDKTAKEKNPAGSNKGEDAYKEMHQSIYEKTFIYRKYLKEYFTSTNVESGTFSDKNNVITVDEETEISQMTKVTDERLSWLKNTDMQGQANPQSTTEDEMKSDPITLLWYFEEASFYSEHFQQPENSVPFMSYLPYPNFDVKANTNVQDGADIQFYLN